MNSLPKTVTRQRRDCDLNPGSTLTTLLRSHLSGFNIWKIVKMGYLDRVIQNKI